jgi:type I restriction enzyme S subunit
MGKTELPIDWNIRELGKLCRITKGVQFNKIDLSDNGSYPCINGGIEPSGYSEKWNTEKGTITISEGGNSCGYVNFIPTRFWSGGHCYSLLELSDRIDNNFLFQALKGKQTEIMDLRVGSGLPNIQQKAIKAFEVNYPNEVTEQRKIASILSKVDEAIQQTEALIAKYSRIKTGLMQDLLTKGIDEAGNIRSEETHEFQDSPLGRIPVDWDYETLGKCIELHNNKRLPISSLIRSKMIGSYPYYGATGIIDRINEFRVEGEYVLFGEDGDHFLKWAFQEQTILVNGKFNVSNHAHIVKGTESCSTKWIHYFFSHRDITLHLTRQGAGRFKLNKASLLSLPILVPKRIDEQEEIINRFETVSKYLDELYSSYKKLYSLKNGLMQDLLSGKVRVNHLIHETQPKI